MSANNENIRTITEMIAECGVVGVPCHERRRDDVEECDGTAHKRG